MLFGIRIFGGLPDAGGDYVAIILASISVLLVVLVILALPAILRLLRLASRARRDYQRARGTQQLRQIRNSLKILRRRLRSLEQEKLRLSCTLRELEQERTEELSRALQRHLVEARLTEIDGIGPKLQDQIIRYSFDGSLRSLRGAYRVRGVGQQKQWALQHWAEQRERELPHLMKQSFPNKKRINNEYNRKERDITKSLKDVEGKIDSMKQLRGLASAEEERLSEVKVVHFRQAHKQNKEASKAVDQYLQGAFAEWEPMPSWFKTLISEYGG